MRHAARLAELGQRAMDALHEDGLARAAAAMSLAAAPRVTKARAAAASRMERAVATELEGLRLEGARFEVALRALDEIAASGAEAVEMMFSANPGEPIAPLAKVASGGELARIMLAIKTAGAGADKIPTLA